MSKRIPLRSWATPLTIGSFILVSVTGVLMFFKLDIGLISDVHQWFSWLFLIGGCGHIAVNLHSLINILKFRWCKIIVAACMVILTASFFSWGIISGPQLEKPIKQALVDAPLLALASLVRTAPDALLRRLEAHGIIATSQQSVRELSAAHGVSEKTLLAIVFLPE